MSAFYVVFTVYSLYCVYRAIEVHNQCNKLHETALKLNRIVVFI